ncbi:MAG TPA: glycosyltransferase [Mycobacterium sp.]|uniref:glycosyltransferase n=1 Tax=Mycobacterium sp. TaxID=1785 RepID=UPI002C5E83CF|nr:glycosyltransferase [Mycobacterium sp.]HME76563.1 glycosyltransferase [Mycobacterium sp.]
MKFVVAGYGGRGDVEPCVAVGRELLRRGHDVQMAVPPNMLGFVESAGLAGVAFGPDSREEMNPGSDLVRRIMPKIKNPLSVVPDVIEHVTQVKLDKSATLTALADGADLMLAGFNEQGLAANVAEYYRIPAVALHPFPERFWSSDWLFAQMTKVAEGAQRQTLGLPEATAASARSLDIEAYDEFCLPVPAAELMEPNGRRAFVGALTLELPTDADQEVLSWIAAGTPPIYFGLGSAPISTPADTFTMISAACAQIGERVLICSGPNDVTHVEHFDHVKVVPAVNHAAILPACRAVVHHGGAGTTAAALRAGIPALILWLWLDQPIWTAGLQRLEVGFGQPFSETTQESLVAGLRVILTPHVATRAREVASYMTKPAESLARAADLLENTARRGR